VTSIWYAALYGECRADAQIIIFPKIGRGLASRSVHWGTWRKTTDRGLVNRVVCPFTSHPSFCGYS